MRSNSPRSIRATSFVEARRRGALAAEGRDEVAGQADRADADRRGAGQLLGPAGEVQSLLAVDLGELRLPEAPLRAVQHVDAGFDQRLQPIGHGVGRSAQAGGEILLLPLADAQDDGEVGPDRRSDRRHDLGGEARRARLIVAPP